MKNEQIQSLITELKKTAIEQNVNIWKRVASDLEAPSNQRRIVNLSKIDKHCQDGDVIVVPGKVLSMGDLTKKVTVAAYSFSGNAHEKINKVGKAITIDELVKKNPKGSKIRVIG
jgi:large subunit ribosomal protein L18e